MPDPAAPLRSDPSAPARTGHITITCAPDGWSADYTHTDKAEGILALFGTAILPLPFTAHAAKTTVAAQLRRVEPFVDIR